MAKPAQSERIERLSHADFLNALKHIDSFVDVNEADLKRIFDLALSHAQNQRLTPEQICLGHYYAIGQLDADWMVCQVIEMETDSKGRQGVIYKPLTSPEKDSVYMTMEAFLDKAKYEMRCESGRWMKEPSA